MEFLTYIVILSFGLFVLYKTGLMDLTQKTIEKSAQMADRKMDELDMAGYEKHTKTIGKIIAKLDDEKINRGTAADYKASVNALEARLAAARAKSKGE